MYYVCTRVCTTQYTTHLRALVPWVHTYVPGKGNGIFVGIIPHASTRSIDRIQQQRCLQGGKQYDLSENVLSGRQNIIRNHSSRPASTASLSTSKGTSCGPLVCLCYTRVAKNGRSFPSARVIVVVLPLPSVLNVFPSVEPTTIVNVCIQFAGFEQN